MNATSRQNPMGILVIEPLTDPTEEPYLIGRMLISIWPNTGDWSEASGGYNRIRSDPTHGSVSAPVTRISM
jgi:hypothetical protein